MRALRGLLRLYPRPWRDRYEEEMSVVLAAGRPTLRTAVDLVAGAIDARLNPQVMPRLEPTSHQRGALSMTNLLTRCKPEEITTAQHLRSAGWLLGLTAALTAAWLGLKAQFGDTTLIEALGAAVFPIAVVLSMRSTYLKRYSAPAAWIMIGAMIVLVLTIALAAEIVAERL
jgi:hypothetical protein